jgi:predicted transposase/invertase (TIGR01784 family)
MDISKILPTNDIMFKIIFGDPKHSNILIRFLNCIIKGKDPIRSVEILPTELSQEHVSTKGVRLDIVATTDSNEIIYIDMQKRDQKDIVGRSLYYWSRLFAGQVIVGERYNNLKKTISINILEFNLFQEDGRYWRKGHLKDDLNNKNLTDLLEMHIIELNKVGEIDKESPLTFWIEFFKDPYSKSVEAMFEVVPEIREAKRIFEKAKSDPEAREWMRVLEKAKMDYASDLATAKDEGREEGMEKGIELGMEKGMEKGREEGREEGIELGMEKGEKKKAIEAARNFLAMGLSVEQVAKGTGLSIPEVEAIKQN